ncbi:MAG: extracellular solute-binding protein [Anaerolineae bacterium]
MSDRRLNRRQFLAWSAIVSSSAVLAGCRPQEAAPAGEAPAVAEATPQVDVAEPTAASAPETIQLRVSAWGDTPDKNINERVAKGLLEANGKIKMVPETYVGDYYDKVRVNFAGGTPPDLVYMEGYQWQPFADFVVPLDDLIERDGLKDNWAGVENYDTLTTWRGKTYLTVVDSGPIVIFYNKMLFDKQGVPYPTNDWTFSDFKEIVAKMTFEEDGTRYYGYSITGGGGTGGYVWWINWLRMDGKTEFDTILEPHTAQWNLPEIAEALQFVNQDIITQGYAPAPATLKGGGIDVATDRVAMCLQGPWALPRYYGPEAMQEGGVSFDVVMPPKGAAGSKPDAEIQGHMIASQSKYQDEAWECMKYWMGEETAKITAEEGRMCGTPQNTEKYWAPIAKETFHFEHADVFAEAQLNGECPVCGGAAANYTAFTGAGGPLQVAADAMAVGDKTAIEALTEANDLMQNALDEYWAKQG